MVKGPEVEIFVGPKKRCFQLPKKLLAYYSPVFDRCFSGEFVEGETQKMECPEDTVEDFEVLLEYILYSNATNALSITKNAENTADGCISFVVFADNYDLGDVSSDVYSLLRPALVKYGKSGFKATYIEDLFGATRQGSCLWELIADSVISLGEVKGLKSSNVSLFKKQEDEVEGFSLIVSKRIVDLASGMTLKDPFTGKKVWFHK